MIDAEMLDESQRAKTLYLLKRSMMNKETAEKIWKIMESCKTPDHWTAVIKMLENI